MRTIEELEKESDELNARIEALEYKIEQDRIEYEDLVQKANDILESLRSGE